LTLKPIAKEKKIIKKKEKTKKEDRQKIGGSPHIYDNQVLHKHGKYNFQI